MTIFRRHHKVYIKPNKRITDKDEIIEYAKTYFYNNSLIDLYWFIHNDMQYPDLPESFARDVAYKMVGSGKFKFAFTNNDKDFLIIKSSWTESRPLRFAIIVAVISAILSVIASRLTDQDKSQLQFLKDTQQDSIIHDLQQRTTNLQIDTAHHL
jgi:hypothetical protein